MATQSPPCTRPASPSPRRTTRREIAWSLGGEPSRLVVHADGRRTGGAVTVAEHHWPAGSAGGLHSHGLEDEGFYVIEGELTVTMPDLGESYEVGPGEFLWHPRLSRHDYAVSEAGPARLLQFLVPGGDLVPGFFADIEAGRSLDDVLELGQAGLRGRLLRGLRAADRQPAAARRRRLRRPDAAAPPAGHGAARGRPDPLPAGLQQALQVGPGEVGDHADRARDDDRRPDDLPRLRVPDREHLRADRDRLGPRRRRRPARPPPRGRGLLRARGRADHARRRRRPDPGPGGRVRLGAAGDPPLLLGDRREGRPRARLRGARRDADRLLLPDRDRGARGGHRVRPGPAAVRRVDEPKLSAVFRRAWR